MNIPTNPDSINLKDLHKEISLRLGKLDFGGLHPGFHPFRFALYDGNTVCFGDSEIPWDKRFIGNSAIDCVGELIAIWDARSASADMDKMAANLAHEMLHAYQRERKDTVWPDEMDGAFYPRDFDNFRLRALENQALAGLVEKFDGAGWADFKALRAHRLRLYPAGVNYEIKAEGIEGSAAFVEMEALKQLSPELYHVELENTLRRLRAPANVFDARKISYDTGAVLRLVLRGAGVSMPDWEKEKPAGAETAGADISDLRGEFENYFNEIDKKVKDALSGAGKLDITGKKLFGFDPYNMRSSGNYLYHPHFIAVAAEGEEPEFIMGTFVTKMAARSRTIEEAWKAAR
jgi:hypothetical protein